LLNAIFKKKRRKDKGKENTPEFLEEMAESRSGNKTCNVILEHCVIQEIKKQVDAVVHTCGPSRKAGGSQVKCGAGLGYREGLCLRNQKQTNNNK
jgi:hypothetical protein